MPKKALENEVSDQASTREKLILAAEKLFAEMGVDAVSLRNICVEAGQRNVASVHYHFGDKASLLEAIFKYREAQLGPRRVALLEAALAKESLPDIRTLLRVAFDGYAELLLREPNKMTYLFSVRQQIMMQPILRNAS